MRKPGEMVPTRVTARLESLDPAEREMLSLACRPRWEAVDREALLYWQRVRPVATQGRAWDQHVGRWFAVTYLMHLHQWRVNEAVFQVASWAYCSYSAVLYSRRQVQGCVRPPRVGGWARGFRNLRLLVLAHAAVEREEGNRS